MFNQEFKNWYENNVIWEPFVKLQRINSEAYEQAVREWTSFMTDSMATLMKGMQILPRIKNPEDLSETHIKLMQEQGEKFLGCVKNMGKIYQSAFKNQTDWIQEMVPKQAAK